MTRDEQLVLVVFDVAQRGEFARLDAHLSWLLAAPPTRPRAKAPARRRWRLDNDHSG